MHAIRHPYTINARYTPLLLYTHTCSTVNPFINLLGEIFWIWCNKSYQTTKCRKAGDLAVHCEQQSFTTAHDDVSSVLRRPSFLLSCLHHRHSQPLPFFPTATQTCLKYLTSKRKFTNTCHFFIGTNYRGADKSLARPTSRFILFDGENISFDASLVIYINSTNIPPILIINRIFFFSWRNNPHWGLYFTAL